MSTYAITFQINYGSSTGWNRRYDSLMEAVNKCRKVWKEPTSFCLVETDETLEALERRLHLTEFDASQDILFVIAVSYDGCILRGAAKEKSKVQSLMPLVQLK